jgi:2-polyprenyl-3-methyl-5-hydroxy-6-metoxy-1,4-benzoquinol methylase
MGAFERRRSFLLKYVSPNRDIGLEFGPLAHPLVQKQEGKIAYADYLDRASLIKKYSNVRNPDDIVEIDYLIDPEQPLDRSIPEKFNYLIACHVIEHIPNIIDWLLQLSDLLLPKGFLYLVVPDKRYTFDILRPLTPLSHILDDYHRNIKKAEVDHVFEQLYLLQDIKAKDVWNGQLSGLTMKPRRSASETYNDAVHVYDTEQYPEVHCHVFTSQQFMIILQELIEMKLIPYSISEFEDVINPYNEFIVILQKNMI